MIPPDGPAPPPTGPSPPRPLVAKVGGREIVPGPAFELFLEWVVRESAGGRPLVLVHGGGDEVTALAERLGLPSRKVDGQRVTPPEVLPLVEGVLAGPVNLRLVSALVQRGVRAVGLSGVSAHTVVAADVRAGALGLVGEPVSSNPGFVQSLLDLSLLPVFAPLASDGRGGVLNVNADLFAAELARGLEGELLLLTDVPGVRDAQGLSRARLVRSDAEAMVAEGTISGGMVPKVEAALRALDVGPASACIGTLVPTPAGPVLRGTWLVPDAADPTPAGPAGTSPLLPTPVGPGGD